MRPDEICFIEANVLAKCYAAKQLSPMEVMESLIERVGRINPAINAIVTTSFDTAMKEARAAEASLMAGDSLPPLFGVPVAIKDVTPTAGIRTTWGSKIFENHIPAEDGLVVQRLKAAGAIIVGKTNTPEFAAGAHTFNDVFGVTRNPWNLELSAGGSSGGSAAAVAAGLVPIAEGSDLGGSLRTPAAFCGVVGFRGSPGLIPMYPTTLSWNTLSVQGPIARSVKDIALALSVMAGRDDKDPISYDIDPVALRDAPMGPDVKGCRIAWTPDLNGLLPVDAEIIEVASRACDVFRDLGATVEDACPDFSGLEEIVLGTRGVSMVAAHADKLDKWESQMQEGLVWNIRQGLALTPRDIGKAELQRAALWHRVRTFMQQYDYLILPGTAAQPFPVELQYPAEIAGVRMRNYMEWFFLTYAISVTGLPVVSVPCGFSLAQMPVGLQIVGRRRDEVGVLRAAAAFEAAKPWVHLRPAAIGN